MLEIDASFGEGGGQILRSALAPEACACTAWPPRRPGMIPVHERLSCIRWDAQLAKSCFVIGYWDRVAGTVLHADLREISWDADNPTLIDLLDEAGAAHSISSHRIRAVWQDGKLIWQRHPPSDIPM